MKKSNAILLQFTLVITASFICQADPMILQPNLGWLSDTFPELSYSTVTMIVTLSAAFLGCAAFFTSKAASMTGKKKLLLAGTCLFTAGGVLSSIAPSFVLILVCRAIEGIGAGFAITVTMTLIPALFPEDEKSNRILGANAVSTALWGTCLGISAGYIGEISWKLANLLYAFGAVLLILQILTIPSDKDMAKDKNNENISSSFTADAFSVSVMAFLFAVVSTMFMTSVAAFTVENGLGSSGEAGTTVSVMTIGSLLIGFAFSTIFRKLKSLTPVISFIFMALGVIIPVMFPSFICACASAFIFGMGYGIYFPYINAEAIRISPVENIDANLSLVNGGYYIGMFASSFLMALINRIFNDSSATFNYKFMGVVFILFVIYYIIRGCVEHRKNISSAS